MSRSRHFHKNKNKEIILTRKKILLKNMQIVALRYSLSLLQLKPKVTVFLKKVLYLKSKIE